MGFTIVTQSRGDAARIAEWVTYHHRLGFDDFQIILDGLVDDTDEVLAGPRPARADRPCTATPRRATTSTACPPAERARRVAQWRVDNAEWRATLKGKALDPIAVRQFQRIPEVLAPYAAGDRGRGWVALHRRRRVPAPARYDSIRDLARAATMPRLRFLNFNVDTSGHDPARPVLEQHTLRWAREDVVQHPNSAWVNRVKSMVRYRKCLPFFSVHRISRGRAEVLDAEVARLHHFRIPLQPLDPPLPYRVDDPLRMPALRS